MERTSGKYFCNVMDEDYIQVDTGAAKGNLVFFEIVNVIGDEEVDVSITLTREQVEGMIQLLENGLKK